MSGVNFNHAITVVSVNNINNVEEKDLLTNMAAFFYLISALSMIALFMICYSKRMRPSVNTAMAGGKERTFALIAKDKNRFTPSAKNKKNSASKQSYSKKSSKSQFSQPSQLSKHLNDSKTLKESAIKIEEEIRLQRVIQYFDPEILPKKVMITILSFLTEKDKFTLCLLNTIFYEQISRLLEETKHLEEREFIGAEEKQSAQQPIALDKPLPLPYQKTLLFSRKIPRDLLEKSKSSKWVAIINNHSLKRSLQIPPYFGDLSPQSPVLHKVIGWISFTYDIINMQDPKAKTQIIQSIQLGDILGRCAQILNSIPIDQMDETGQELILGLRNISTQMFGAMIECYFQQSTTWQGRVEIPTGLQEENPRKYKKVEGIRQQILSFPINVLRSRTFLTAWDSDEKRLVFSGGKRLFFTTPSYKKYLKIFQTECKQKIDRDLQFTSDRELNKFMVQLLLTTSLSFRRSKASESANDQYRYIRDFSLIRGRFLSYLTSFCDENAERLGDESPILRKMLFDQLYHLFPEMFPKEKWEALSELFQSSHLMDGGRFRDAVYEKIFRDYYLKDSQALMMTIAMLTCGEVKVALDCCREAGNLSLEQRSTLSQTLRERLHFSTIRISIPLAGHKLTRSMVNQSDHVEKITQIGQCTVASLNICDKCISLWPVFEAMYWAILKSGFNIAAMEDLEDHLQYAQSKLKTQKKE